MKKRLLILLAIVSLAMAIFTGVATSSSYSGSTFLQTTGDCLGGAGVWLGNVHIAIRNVTTGANGATNSNGSGQFSIGGLVSGNRYEFVTSYPGKQSCLYHYTASSQNVTGAHLSVL